MKFITIGDSHSCNGWNEKVSIIHIGPSLCYGFNRKILEYNNNILLKTPINNEDVLIFCFGEIDCRCHIHKHITPEKPYTTIIDELTDNYIKAIKKFIEINNINPKISIYNIVPPVSSEIGYKYTDLPLLGTNEERTQYVLYFNKKIKDKCFENNYIFFDIYDKYTDENGFLNRDFADDTVHIRDGRYIDDFLDKILCSVGTPFGRSNGESRKGDAALGGSAFSQQDYIPPIIDMPLPFGRFTEKLYQKRRYNTLRFT